MKTIYILFIFLLSFIPVKAATFSLSVATNSLRNTVFVPVPIVTSLSFTQKIIFDGPIVRSIQKIGNGTINAGVTNFYMFSTNDNFLFTISGTPTIGQLITVLISNTAPTTDINLTNWSAIFDKSINNTVTNVIISSNSVSQLNYRYTGSGWMYENNEFLQYNLTPSGNVSFLTNGNIVLIIGSVNPLVGTLEVTNNISYLPNTISGAGNGNTNYTLQSTMGKMYLGSSNVNIVATMGYTPGKIQNSSISVTNLSGNNWGISWSAVTNRYRFAGTYGTNAPTVLTNNTLLLLSFEIEGTNVLVGYTYFSPAL